jgi:hypothetical protein
MGFANQLPCAMESGMAMDPLIPKAWDVTMAQSFVIREIIRKK